jgi:hypothetical protein
MNEEAMLHFRMVLIRLRGSLDEASAHAQFLRGFDHDDPKMQESTNYICGLLDSAVAEGRSLRDKVK